MARKTVLYIAMSLDGFICDDSGGVGWLMHYDAPADAYHKFYQTIDTVVLGKKTYDQIVTELSPDEWAYKGKLSLVATSQTLADTDDIIFVNDDIVNKVLARKQKPGKNIWLVGGAQLIHAFVKADAIDEYIITVAPLLLGSGTPLFLPQADRHKLTLKAAEQVGGFAMLTYKRA